MARKKTIEDQEQTAPVQVGENEAQEQTATITKVAEVTGELPKHVKKLLETYSKYAALYIDTKGGVYTEETQPNLRGDAILYQNPYYKQ